MSRLHFLRTRAQFDAAHARWEEPPDDPPYVICEVCDGRGSRMVLDEGFKPYRAVCECCQGAGKLDAETGQPWDEREFARMAEGHS